MSAGLAKKKLQGTITDNFMNQFFENVVIPNSVSLAVMFVIMLIGWVASIRLKNAGIVDVIWAFSFGLLAVIFASFEQGLPARRLLLLTIVLPWSMRLGAYLLKRFLREFPREDKRYAAWRSEWKERATRNMFWVFQLQGFLISILGWQFALSCADPSPIRFSDLLGVAIGLIGFVGESVADCQLAAFKCNPSNIGKVCTYGLWNFSRHPNYFFEWLVWIGLFVFTSSSQLGLYTIYSPLLMLFMLTKVSGVKLTEQHALQARGSEYENYQKTTSAFVPWFKFPISHPKT
jgi:steroid 5-alpha reductase family enzyme